MPPIFCAFYTIGTLYEQEAARLARSLDRFGLPRDIVGVPSAGDWTQNSRLTAGFICRMLEKHAGRPVVYLDADAVVNEYPVMFDDMGDCDLGAHVTSGGWMNNGTLYLAPTPAARKAIDRYADLIIANPGCTNEQKMLEQAVVEMRGELNVRQLPAEYCYIADHMRGEITGPVVIAHHQASRERNRSEAWERRQQWGKDWDAAHGGAQ